MILRAKWDGDCLDLFPDAQEWCAENLKPGEVVSFEFDRERSGNNHRHQFAWVSTAWENFEDEGQPWLRSPETLRKHALIATGHCNAETLTAGSKAAAERLGAYVSALANKAHGYAVATVRGDVVTCYTPHSQSYKAMGGEVFAKSKRDILNWIAQKLGVDPGDLE